MFQTSEDDVSVTRQTTSIEPLERLEEHLEIKSTMDGYEALKGLSTSVFFFLLDRLVFLLHVLVVASALWQCDSRSVRQFIGYSRTSSD